MVQAINTDATFQPKEGTGPATPIDKDVERKKHASQGQASTEPVRAREGLVLNQETQDKIVALFPDTKGAFDAYRNQLSSIDQARIKSNEAAENAKKTHADAVIRENDLVDLHDAAYGLPSEGFNQKLRELLAQKSYSLTPEEKAALEDPSMDKVKVLEAINKKYEETKTSVNGLKTDFDNKNRANEDLSNKTKEERENALKGLRQSLEELAKKDPALARYLPVWSRDLDPSNQGSASTEDDGPLKYYDPKTIHAEVAAENGLAKFLANYFKNTENIPPALRAAYETGQPLTEEQIKGLPRNVQGIARILNNGLNGDFQSYGKFIDGMTWYAVAQANLPDSLRRAFASGKKMSDKDIQKLPEAEQILARKMNESINEMIESTKKNKYTNHDSLMRAIKEYRAATGKPETLDLPRKVGQVGYAWNEDGTLRSLHFGDNKASWGSPDLMKLSGLLMENPEKFKEFYLVNGRIDNRRGDRLLAEHLGVSQESIKEFFASFPGSSSLPNAVKNGTIKPEQIAECVAACMGNQIHIAERLIAGKGIKRDEFKHVLMNLTSPSTLAAAGITLATGGSGAQVGYSMLINSVPMGDGLRLLLGIVPGQLGLFGRRSGPRRIIGGGNGGGNGIGHQD